MSENRNLSQYEWDDTEEEEQRDLLLAQLQSLGWDVADPYYHTVPVVELQALLDRETADDAECDDVIIEEHERGENDMMSGALPEWYESGLTHQDEHDATVCVDDFFFLHRHMPNYMLGVEALRRYNFVTNKEQLDDLGDDFYTTIDGIKRAWEEANLDKEEGHPTDDWDVNFLCYLSKRGGSLADQWSRVRYPGDLEQTCEDTDDEFWYNISCMRLSEEERWERERREELKWSWSSQR
jgi:hypothetical protein